MATSYVHGVSTRRMEKLVEIRVITRLRKPQGLAHCPRPRRAGRAVPRPPAGCRPLPGPRSRPVSAQAICGHRNHARRRHRLDARRLTNPRITATPIHHANEPDLFSVEGQGLLTGTSACRRVDMP
ncbi:hypothetical protein [Arthrobacter sp. MYb213]|uniref:hypothetical protein n=1 Tax=Arthrobacter sp. MYb213 TaxID=1848595 RepID=UPI00336A0460